MSYSPISLVEPGDRGCAIGQPAIVGELHTRNLCHPGRPKQISQILSIDASYDLADWLTLGAKYDYRQGRVSLGRASNDFVSSTTHLGVIRADVHFVKNWEALVEGRAHQRNIGQRTRWLPRRHLSTYWQ